MTLKMASSSDVQDNIRALRGTSITPPLPIRSDTPTYETSVTPPLPIRSDTPTYESPRHQENAQSPVCTSRPNSPEEKPNCPPKSPPKEPGSPVSEDACPICLGSITDKCVAGSCLHNFCFVCLKEWSKQKPVCPLCKQPFDKIIYDIISEKKYKEWVVPKRVVDPAEINIRRYREFFGREGRRFFGYRTTQQPVLVPPRRFHIPELRVITDSLPSGPRERRPPRRHMFNLSGLSMFRLSVYLENIWVQPLADVTGRFRDCSPAIYREQPALTHRLAPWLNREIAALLPSSQIGYLLGFIMELIKQYAINSQQFKRALSEHLGERTAHFIHEFYNFARSPFDMVGYDNIVQYVPHHQAQIIAEIDDTSSEDSDAIIEVDANTGAPVDLFRPAPIDMQDNAGNVVREETLTNEGSVVISSGSDSSMDDEDAPFRIQISDVQTISDTQNPEPPRHLNILKRNNFLIKSSSTSTSSLSPSTSQAGPSGSRENGNKSFPIKPEYVTDNEQPDDCLVLDILPPKQNRTPELISIDTESDNEAIHVSDDSNGRVNRKRNSRRKPHLDRTSFALHNISNIEAGPSGGINNGNDHSYCNADDYDLHQISTDHNQEIIESTPDLSSQSNENSDERSFRILNKHKYSVPRTSSSRGLSNGSSSSSSSSSSYKPKKDHYSKVKSSTKASNFPSTRTTRECIFERHVYTRRSFTSPTSSYTESQESDGNETDSSSTSSRSNSNYQFSSSYEERLRRTMKASVRSYSSSDDEYLTSSADRDRVKSKNKQEYFSKRLGASRSKYHNKGDSSNRRSKYREESQDSLSDYYVSRRKRNLRKLTENYESSDSEDESRHKRRKIKKESSDDIYQPNKHYSKSKKSQSKKKKKSKKHSESSDEEYKSHRKAKSEKRKLKENKSDKASSKRSSKTDNNKKSSKNDSAKKNSKIDSSKKSSKSDSTKKKNEKSKYKTMKCKSRVKVKKEKRKTYVCSSSSE